MTRIRFVTILAAAAALSIFTQVNAAEQYGGDREGLLRDFPRAQISLIEGIRQVASNGEVATVAKFEHEDGQLYLSVYTSENGLGADAEHNVLKEYKAPVADVQWMPDAGVFEDFEHIARSAMYHTLLAMSPYSLVGIANKALADEAGQVLWVRPIVENGTPLFDVAVFREGELVKVRYHLVSGQRLE